MGTLCKGFASEAVQCHSGCRDNKPNQLCVYRSSRSPIRHGSPESPPCVHARCVATGSLRELAHHPGRSVAHTQLPGHGRPPAAPLSDTLPTATPHPCRDLDLKDPCTQAGLLFTSLLSIVRGECLCPLPTPDSQTELNLHAYLIFSGWC